MKKLFTLLVTLVVTSMSVSAQAVYEWYTTASSKETQTPAGSNFFTVNKGEGTAAAWSSKSKHSGTYTTESGTTIKCTDAVKMEGTTQMLFTSTAAKGRVVIVQTTSNATGAKLKFDDVALADGVDNPSSGDATVLVFTINDVAAGDHKITRTSETGLMYVKYEEVVDASDTRETPDFSWVGATTVAYKVRAVIPELPSFKNESNFKVEFSSSNEDVATVSADGVITAKNDVVGKAVITASYPGDDTYKEYSATVMIDCQTNVTVVKAGVEAAEYFKMTKMAQKSKDSNYSAGANFVEEDALITVTMPYASTVQKTGKTFFDRKFDAYAQVRVADAPTKDNPVGTENKGSTSLVIKPAVDMTLVIFGRRQMILNSSLSTFDDDVENNVITRTDYYTCSANDGKSLCIVDQDAPEVKLDQEIRIGAYDSNVEYGFVATFVELEAGKTYTAYAVGTTYGVYAIGYIIAPAAPTHTYGDENIVEADDAVEVVFETEAEHHLVYTCFVPTNEVAETNARATSDMTHESLEGATFTHAADNKVTVSESGTLHYFAYDPETELKSELKTLDFSVATGIATIAADGVEAVEYYNLQGQRVANPAQGGLYIRKAGSKAEKVIL